MPQPGARRRVILVEPEINPITRRFGLPIIATYPPLAQVRLAGQIEGGDVAIADLRIPGEKGRFLASLAADPPALIGISVTFTSNGDEALELARAARQASPGTTIVLGGTAPSEDPSSFLDSAADLIGFRGGDASLPALIAEVRREGGPPERFPGFFHREKDGWALDAGPPGAAMEALEPCAWHLIPPRYWKHYHQGFRVTGMGQTSEGCPFDCTFCSVWITHGRRVSLASLANVQHDFRSLPAHVRGFFFADDIWMQASEAQIQVLYDPLLSWLAGAFLKKRAGFWMTVETRTDLYLRQEARFRDWIGRAGLKWILFGVESATDEGLEAFSKRNSVDTNSEAIRRAAEAGAYVTAQFVIPCEADTREFDELIRFLRAHRGWIRHANFTIATPLPGTMLYRQALEQSPELADRSLVGHPAFSLFTALSPTRLPAKEFYRQVARLYTEAAQVRITREGLVQALRSLRSSPWLIPRILRMPAALRALRDPGTFLQAHRQVQGERLLEPRTLSA